MVKGKRWIEIKQIKLEFLPGILLVHSGCGERREINSDDINCFISELQGGNTGTQIAVLERRRHITMSVKRTSYLESFRIETNRSFSFCRLR